MKINPLVYWLVHDRYTLEDNPRIIHKPQGSVMKIDFDEKRFSFGRGSFISDWPTNVICNIEGDDPVDLLSCSAYINAVSERARNIIQKYAKSDVEFLPVKLVYVSGKPYKKMDYWAINVMTVVDALNWEKTKWTSSVPPSRDDPKATFKIGVPGFIKSKVENINFFRYEINGKPEPAKYMSWLVKEELERSGAYVGMEFAPIRTD